MLEAVVLEVAKAATASLAGVAITGTGNLVKRLRGRLGDLDGEDLQERIREAARQDPAFGQELAMALAEVIPGGGTWSPEPPYPFYNRSRELETAPDSGVLVIGGIPGSGRTALARCIAYQKRDAFPFGRVELDLDDHRTFLRASHHAGLPGGRSTRRPGCGAACRVWRAAR